MGIINTKFRYVFESKLSIEELESFFQNPTKINKEGSYTYNFDRKVQYEGLYFDRQFILEEKGRRSNNPSPKIIGSIEESNSKTLIKMDVWIPKTIYFVFLLIVIIVSSLFLFSMIDAPDPHASATDILLPISGAFAFCIIGLKIFQLFLLNFQLIQIRNDFNRRFKLKLIEEKKSFELPLP